MDTLFISFLEGETEHRLQVGFESWQRNRILEHDEPYLVAVKGSLKTDEKDRLTLILDVHFLEEACSRKFKFFFEKGKIELRVTEAPGDDIIMDGISYAGDPESLKGIPFLGNVMDKGGMSLLTGSVIDLIHPVVFGREKAADPSDHIPEADEELLSVSEGGETEESDASENREEESAGMAGAETAADQAGKADTEDPAELL